MIAAPLLLVLIAVSASIHLHADAVKRYAIIYVFKPLTVLLILALAAVSEQRHGLAYWGVLAGLAFSLLGDLFLMLKDRQFTKGLISFLLAHLCYVCAWMHPPSVNILVPVVPLVIAGLLLYQILRPGLGRNGVPVLIYLVVLLLMLLTALNRWLAMPCIWTGVTAAGAVLFVISDAILAVRQFRRDFPGAQAAILVTYYCAQTLIALG